MAEWTFEPSEAVDGVVFCNAISNDQMYARHYPGLRAEWAGRLGGEGLRAVDRLREVVSMSDLCALLCCADPTTLQDVVELTGPRGMPRLREALEADAAAAQVEYLRAALRALTGAGTLASAAYGAVAAAGFASRWAAGIRPGLEAAAARQRDRAAGHPLAEIEAALASLLGAPRRPAGGRVLLAHYIQPISFRLPGRGMAAHPDHIPSPDRLGCLCIHESLHGFPGVGEALAEQGRVLAGDPVFAWHHRALQRDAHIGPEEHLVTGAEAFLTERLGLRTAEQCRGYLGGQNGGMPFAAAVYSSLCNADMTTGWPGFGQWISAEMRAGRITFASGAAALLQQRWPQQPDKS